MKINVRGLIVGICVSLSLMISSCNDGPDVEDPIVRWRQEVNLIDTDLEGAGISAVKDPESGISMIITKLGTGLPAQQNNTVDIDYVGKRYSDKVVFDDGNIKSILSSFIPGWQVALSKLPEGSEAKVIIPSIYGYGTSGSGSLIPGNSILEFDIRFNEVIPSSSDLQLLESGTADIDTYLANKSIEAIEDTTGIRYVFITQGAGPSPSWYNKLTINYTIKLLSDDTKTITTVERTPSENYYSRPIDYIHGMKIGLQKLSIGSKAVFYIPSVYAFGADGASNGTTGASIPANANIIVEVELLNIE